MRRSVFFLFAATLLATVLLAGCSTLSADRPTHEIVRESQINTSWQMYQIKLNIPAGSEFPVLLKLGDGDKVDGKFYLEKGNNVNFSINGNSQVYQTQKPTSGKINSDRFSFTASQAQGSSYTLLFSNPKESGERAVVFLDMIYPLKSSIFIPLETKKVEKED